MNCKNCKDREFCYSFKAGLSELNVASFRQTYLRTLRCKQQKFGQ